MKVKSILFILTLIIFTSQLVLSASQSLTYDNSTNQINMSYDSLNRILTKNSTGINATYAYDEQYQGTLTNIAFSNSTYKYEYDDKLRITREIKTIDGIQFEKRNYYDSMDRLIKQDFVQVQNISYYYNEQGKVNKILNFINNTFYNQFDNTLNRTYANSKLTEFTYDTRNGRLTNIKTGSIQNLNYTYDLVGNVIIINDSVNNRVQRMAYDFLDRLVNATINSNTFTYSHNAIGNILKIVKDSLNTTKFVYSNYPTHAPSWIITGDAGADIHKQSELYSSNKTRAIQFYLANEKNTTLTSINWTIDAGNGNIINSTVPINISTNESILVIFQQNYTNAGNYKLNISATSIDFENVSIKFGIKALSLSILNRDVTNTNFQLHLYNDMNLTSQDVSWSCTNGISSNNSFTMSGYENKLVNFSYNYPSAGVKILTCTANSTDGTDSKTINFEIKGIKIEGVNISSTAYNNRLVRFNITNYYHSSSINWNITSDNQMFGNSVTLASNQSILISQEINYTTDGAKTILINISSGNMTDRYNESFILKAIKIEDFDSNKLNETNWLTTFTIKNYWPLNQSIRWNMSDPSISSNTTINLTGEGSVIVIIENNYTTQGKKKPVITAYNGSSIDSYIGNFLVKMVETVRQLVLVESRDSTIIEIIARNNLGKQIISWLLNTEQEGISSNQSILLNTSEEVFIIIEANYSNSGIYPVNVSINSSSYNDNTVTGVSIT